MKATQKGSALITVVVLAATAVLLASVIFSGRLIYAEQRFSGRNTRSS